MMSPDEIEDADSAEVAGSDDALDVDRLMQDLDKRKRGAPKGAEPAWRKLERLMEQKRTSELLLDFGNLCAWTLVLGGLAYGEQAAFAVGGIVRLFHAISCRPG